VLSPTAGVTVPRDEDSLDNTEVERPLDVDAEDLGPLFGAEGTPPQSKRYATEMPAVTVEPTPVAGTIDARILEAEEPRRKRRASAPVVQDEPRYEYGEEIGRGGMGEVVAAHDLQIGRDVAIKRLIAEQPSVGQLARFLREARIQGRLEHPAIPPVYELAHDEHERPYFAMRKLEGVTLAETLRDPRSPFTQQRLLRAFIEICNAIDLAHSRRIVHRDLKPANILLGERGEVYVLDWGIARDLDSPDAFPAGVVMGTPGYMAPEQLRAQPDLDERVDIYALGCILFEIVARRPIHSKGDAGVEQTLRGEFPYDVELPLELQNACRWATSVHRSQRFKTARDLGDVVQRYLDGDRDLEQRRALARHHLASARSAFMEIRDDAARRSIVMREAGKAIALDPTIEGAAELIGRLMLEPPAAMPAPVRRELEDMDLRASKAMANLSIGTSLLHCAVFVILLGCNVYDPVYLPIFGVGSFVMLVVAILGVRYNTLRLHRRLAAVWVTLLLVMIGLVSRMFTPLLVSPTVATISVATLSFNPVVCKRSLALATFAALLATLGIWAAELAGILSSQITWANGTMVLTSPVDGIGNVPVYPLLFIMIGINIVTGAGIGYVAMRAAERARNKLVLQAWHLRQLM
jgi:serine/threonine-protein kinase